MALFACRVRCLVIAVFMLVIAGTLPFQSPAAAAESAPWAAIIAPDNSLSFNFTNDGAQVFHLGIGGWGPNWSWVGVDAHDKAVGEKLSTLTKFVVNADRRQVIDIKYSVAKVGPRQIAFRYDLSAPVDVPVTMVIAGLGVEASAKGTLVLNHASGKPTTFNLPLGRGGENEPAVDGVLHLAKSGDIGLKFDPPCPMALDGDLRIQLATDVFKKGTNSQTVTLTFPADIDFLASQHALETLTRTLTTPDWFPFQPSDKFDGASKQDASVIGMDAWLDRPAGKHGGVRTVGDHFEFTDGTRVKFWGVNLSYGGGCAPEKKDGQFTAARFAKYGINGVRLHKFSYPKDQSGIGDPNDATKMDPEGLDRLDSFASELKKHGVYFGWSHSYNFHVAPGNRSKLAAYDELAGALHGNTYALINFATDVQDLMIEMVVNLLGHKNPYTGLTYAEEPALSYIECQNEDDIFFYTSSGALNNCPTYRRLFVERFSDWLAKKYGSDDAFRAAWGDALPAGQSAAKRNVVPELNPWFFGSDHLLQVQAGQRQKLLDTAHFLHECQNEFYQKFVRAVRKAGYAGPLVGSPWQAPAMLPHYLNLKSDYDAGYIDRHNYFGGGLNDSMLKEPGSGYFSSGLQQVVDRPFGLSEWIHVYPSLYSAEGPAILAAYGMGLQGWDASYEFQSQSAGRNFDDKVGWLPWGVWEADTPTQIGQFPTLARMIYRGDVNEGEVISVRRISQDDLQTGKFNFSDKVVQQGDVKSFGGSVPPGALAAGRVVVEFTDKSQSSKSQPSTFPEMDRYRREKTILANNGKLAWDTSGKGFFTVNSAGTKAVVGFAENQPQKLGGITITSKCPYASIVLTAKDKSASLADCNSAIVSVVARSCNTGFKYFAMDQRVLENGNGPVLLEPVKATIDIPGRSIAAINILDHDGRRTDKQLPNENGRFTIDGTRDHAIYYEVLFK